VNVFPLGLDCDTPYFQPAVALEFCCAKPTVLTVCLRLYDRYSSLVVLCSSLLLCWLSGSASQVQHWAFLAPNKTSWLIWYVYRSIPTALEEVYELSPLRGLNTTDLTYLSGLYKL